MKQAFFIVLLPLLFTSCSTPEVPYEALEILLENKNPLTHSLNNKKYSGLAVEYQNSVKVIYHINHGKTTLVEGFYKNGSKERLINYKDGVLHGEYILWYPNGSIYLKQYYENGELNGKATMFNPLGEVERETNYEKGKLVESE
ncbi:MAG: toxin-antitoxin system YwqK family antitoxin [Flavobacteriales bacterium]